MGRRSDRGLGHEITAGPEAASEVGHLFDQENFMAVFWETPRTTHPRRPGPDDNHVTLGELIKLLIEFTCDALRDIPLTKRGDVLFFHGNLRNKFVIDKSVIRLF